MYNIRQFKPTLYLLLFMGVTGFCIASESMGLWILAASAISLNAWLVKTGRFTPMPRLLANATTLAAIVVVSLQLHNGDSTPLITIGEFLVALHVVKLYEQRYNRDYAQLLVLSLLLMVAAALTPTLIVGLIFISHMFISLYCCLLFHLKVEADAARASFGPKDKWFNPRTIEQDQRYLPRSMRRLTALISIFAIIVAVNVFLFFPRSASQILGSPSVRPPPTLIGFSDVVSFQKIAQISVSNETVARVEVLQDNQPLQRPGQLMLRGSTLDQYTGSANSRVGNFTWIRSYIAKQDDVHYALRDTDRQILNGGIGDGVYSQKFSLEPTGTPAIFAMAGAVSISSPLPLGLHYSPLDGVIESEVPLRRPIEYTVLSTGVLPIPQSPVTAVNSGWRLSSIDPAVLEYAKRPEVCGVDAAGKPLASYALAGDHSRDSEIAANFEHHLRTAFTYTLDLTTVGALGNRDPIVAFLTDFKKGHCEYFAGAMTLMCQSLGIPARVVVGFSVLPTSYNSLGNYYLVRASDAHAWCEAFTGSVWESFDPTTNRIEAGTGNANRWAALANFFDYLEFKWASSIVAYDAQARNNVMETLNNAIASTAVNSGQGLYLWPKKLDQWWESAKKSVLAAAIGVISISVLITVGSYFIERARLRRRVRRIGLESLPTPQQIRLAKQLVFYDDLLRTLGRHQIHRPDHLTPLEFSRTLTFLPSSIFADISRLTHLFYRVRYGGEDLNGHRQKQLETVVHRIADDLDSHPIARVAGIT